MKKPKTFWMAATLAAMSVCGCQSYLPEAEEGEAVSITFYTRSAFVQTDMTRALTTSDGMTMTDLWVMDYADGKLLQTVHQDGTQDDFGIPTLSLAIGTHDLYFVCAAGLEPSVQADAHKIVWATPKDAFWLHVSITVSTNTPTTQAVRLNRVATRLSVKISDAIPENVARITVQPKTWYCGLDWLTGNGTDGKTYTNSVVIPAEYIGHTNVKLMTYGMAQETEFTTDATVTALDADDGELARVVITGAPQQKNRSTMFTGALFTASSGMTIELNDTWNESYQATW